jgi:hypothetical protein
MTYKEFPDPVNKKSNHNNSDKGHAKLWLDYFKQGDDMYQCLVYKDTEKTKVNFKKSVEQLKLRLQGVVDHLSAVEQVVSEQSDYDVHAETHCIFVSGTKNDIDNLVNLELLHKDDFHEDDESEYTSDEDDSEEDSTDSSGENNEESSNSELSI